MVLIKPARAHQDSRWSNYDITEAAHLIIFLEPSFRVARIT